MKFLSEDVDGVGHIHNVILSNFATEILKREGVGGWCEAAAQIRTFIQACFYCFAENS